MMADKQPDTKALGWVSEEIRQALNRARAALEIIVENEGASDQLDVILDNLRQVHGTLKMIGLFGGALLTEELINLTCTLKDGGIAKASLDDAHEAMMRGIIQLPAYIDNLQHGQRDIPIILLPLLNDIRALCGGQLLTESAFFSPDLGVFPEAAGSAATDIRPIAKKLRPAYQLSLVNLLRDIDARENLRRAGTVFHQIERNVATPEERQLWWVACGLIESLYEQGLELNASIKHILSILDRRIKDLVNDGEQKHRNHHEILKNTLYYIAQARSQGKRVSLLKEKFSLNDILPDQAETEKARNDLLGLDGSLLSNVADAIHEDMLQIKETMDVYARAKEKEISRLEPVVDKLKTVADTLGMIGMGAERGELVEYQQQLRDAIAAGSPADDAMMMDLASTLLSVESALGQGTEEDSGIVVGQGDFSELIRVAAKEARGVLTTVKEIIDGLVDGQSTPEQLQTLPGHLRSISGALHMLGRPDGADAFNRLSDFLQATLVDGSAAPDSEQLTVLADIITGGEYFIEAVVDDPVGSEKALAVMTEGLDSLAPVVEQVAQSIPQREPELESGPAVGEVSLEDLQSDAHFDLNELGGETPTTDDSELLQGLHFEDADSIEDPSAAAMSATDMTAAMAELPPLAVEEELPETDIEPAAMAETSDFATTSEVVEEVEETVIAAPSEADDDIDEEVMEIFLEEVQEESESVGETLGAWIANAGDAESLGTLRRSFHTIKGSGRIVGASDLGEFAWAIENMLNRLIDKTISRTPEMIQVLEMARDTLPQFISNLKGEGELSADVEAIAAAAHQIAEGRTPQLGASAPVADAADAEQTGSVSGMDPVLAEIFSNETRNHLHTLSVWIGDYDSDTNHGRVSQDLVRALHTLHGSSHMAGVMQMVGLTDYLEKYAKLRQGNNSRTSDEFRTLLEATVQATEYLLATLSDASAALPQQDILEVRARALLDEEGLHEEEGHTQEVAEDSDEVLQAPDAMSPGETDGTASVPEMTGALLAEDVPAPAEPAAAPPFTDELADQLQDEAHDTVDTELLDIFTDEAEEILSDMDQALEAWRSEPGSLPALQGLQRLLHTLKGGARMAGIGEIGDLAHDVESVILHQTEGGTAPDQDRFNEVMQQAHDWFAMAVEKLRDSCFLSRPHHLRSIEAMFGDGPAATVADAAALAEPETAFEPAAGQGDAFDLELTDALVDEAAIDAPAVFAEPPAPAAPAAQTTAPAPAQEIEDSGAYDEELLDIFLEEAGEILHGTDALISQWMGRIEDTEVMKEIQRALHTLKGGARMAGIRSVGDLSHSIETAMEALDEGRCHNHQALLSQVQQSYDWLSEAIEKIRDRQPLVYPAALISSIDTASGVTSQAAAAEPVPPPHTDLAEEPVPPPHTDLTDEPVPPPHTDLTDETADTVGNENEVADPVLASIIRSTEPDEPKTPEEAEQKKAEAPAADSAAPRASAEVVRISSDLLEHLINNAGEMSIYRSRIDQQLSTMTTNLVELESTVGRIRDQLRKFEIEAETQILYRFEGSGDGTVQDSSFDPLELDRFSNMQQLSRSLAESVGDLSSIQKFISGLTRETEILLVQQSRINSELQNGLMRTRLLPFTSILPRLRRIVRQVSQELGKQVEFEVHGAESEMDRSVLNRLVPALEHMLRNAVDHGLETPALRMRSGKAETGILSLSFTRVGSEIILRIDDDGAGMNLDAIRKKAVERGLMRPNSALTDSEVVQFVLEAGFSTAGKVTQISGRGVGMDVVATEIKQLGGSLFINTKPGTGTRFTVHLPLTVSVNQALMVLVGEETYAIPLSSIVGITRLEKYELDRLVDGTDAHYEYADDHYQFFHMGSMMGICRPRTIGEKERIPLILAHAGEHRVALLTEAILGRNEVVVKTVGPQISSVKGISGATIMGDGSVALILDVPNLIRTNIAQIASVQPSEVRPLEAAAEPEYSEPVILVVDDSITVRKVTERLLKRHNLIPVTAKDGLDALDKLEEFTPDLILSDIEMPKMDGYEFISNVKKDPRFDAIPVIMITSRTGEKHRERAMGLGVNLYMGKPFQETELLENINSLLGEQVESE